VIELVAIVTRDRPQRAAALARTLAGHSRMNARSLPILVADDSRDPAMRAQLAALIEQIDAPEIRIVGADERERLALHLVAAGCEADIVEFAIRDPFALDVTPGANRNFIRLLAGGRDVLVLDDDVRLRGLEPPDRIRGVEYLRTPDPNESWFFASRKAFEDARWIDLDVVGELDRALAMPTGKEPPIALTGMGLAGDLGSANALVLLAASPGSRERLMDEPGTYEFVRRSRIVMRTVKRPTAGDGGPWNPAVAAYSGRIMLPPFLPVLRAQGPLFGATIRAGKAWTTLRLPWALQHRIEDDDEHAFDRIIDQTVRPGAAGFMHMLVATGATERGWPDDRLGEIGRRLVTTGELPFASFKDVLASRMRGRQRSIVKTLTEILAKYDRMPAVWAADVDSCIVRATDVLAAAADVVPHDLERHDHPLALLRELVLMLGRLYCAWPQMVDAAKTLPVTAPV
jgi:hypothetical protein